VPEITREQSAPVTDDLKGIPAAPKGSPASRDVFAERKANLKAKAAATTKAHKDYEKKKASANGKATKKATPVPVKPKKDGPTPGERKAELVRVLRKVKATSAGNSKSLKDLGDRLGVEPREVYGLVNGTAGKAGSSPTCLAATGHVKVTSLAGEGLSIYLTKKGQETKFDERPFVREAK
jgi:hypothetical protein